MNVKYIIIVFIVILIFSYGFLFYKFNQNNLLWKEKTNNLEAQYITLKHSMLKTLEPTILSDNKNIDSDLTQCKASHKESCKLKEIRQQLILVIPEKSCNLCYDEVFDELKFAKDTLNMHIYIITTTNKYREIKNKTSSMRLMNEIYYSTHTPFFLERIQYAPYFLYIDAQAIGRHLFIPLTNFSHLTHIYIKNIHQRYSITQ